MRAAAHRQAVAVVGDEAHLVGGHAQPFAGELGEAGGVALPGRQRADHDLDQTLRQHRDLGALDRRPALRFDVAAEPDAAPQPARRGFGPAPEEAIPVGELQDGVERRRVVAAVVGDAEGVGVRRGRDEVAPAERDPVEAVRTGGEIDQPLDHEHGLGPSGTAIGRSRRRVAEHAARLCHRGHPVEAGHELRALGERHEGGRIGAEIAGADGA